MNHDVMDFVSAEEPKFDKTILGVFGSFQTNQSYPVNYILTSMNYREVEDLKVAAEAFDFAQVRFDEMVQRDVDQRRVNEEIVDQYLEEGTEKALFFPPLIVSVVAFDDNNNPLHKYNNSEEFIDDRGGHSFFRKRWDKHFEIELPILKSGIDVFQSENNDELPIYKNAAKIRIDSKLVKLVVIDGQHRYKAIMEYIYRHKGESKFLNLPICICFSPKAIEQNGPEDILDNLRNMFVTINNKGKQVSGHYLDLLNDNSLASHTVRLLANKWKDECADSLESKLHFIEWNQRSNATARRVNRVHSITSVSMLCESLRKSIFLNDKSVAYMYNVLKLDEIKDALEKDGSSVHDISENDFSHLQQPIIYERIENRLLEPLELLLTTPTVYKERIDSFHVAMLKAKQCADNNEPGYRSFLEVMKNFGDVDLKLHPEETKIASDEFYSLIRTDEHLENYRRLVFNQAYLKSWVAIIDSVPIFRDNLLDFTNAFIRSLEIIVFDKTKNPFSKERVYNQFTLYKGNKPNTTNYGKDCWYYLILSTFLNDKVNNVITEFTTSLGVELSELTPFHNLVIEAKNKFVDKVKEQILNDANKNWRFKEYPLSFKNELQSLDETGDAESKTKMKNLIDDKATDVFDERIEILANILGVAKKDLFSR